MFIWSTCFCLLLLLSLDKREATVTDAAFGLLFDVVVVAAGVWEAGEGVTTGCTWRAVGMAFLGGAEATIFE